VKALEDENAKLRTPKPLLDDQMLAFLGLKIIDICAPHVPSTQRVRLPLAGSIPMLAS